MPWSDPGIQPKVYGTGIWQFTLLAQEKFISVEGDKIFQSRVFKGDIRLDVNIDPCSWASATTLSVLCATLPPCALCHFFWPCAQQSMFYIKSSIPPSIFRKFFPTPYITGMGGGGEFSQWRGGAEKSPNAQLTPQLGERWSSIVQYMYPVYRSEWPLDGQVWRVGPGRSTIRSVIVRLFVIILRCFCNQKFCFNTSMDPTVGLVQKLSLKLN